MLARDGPDAENSTSGNRHREHNSTRSFYFFMLRPTGLDRLPPRPRRAVRSSRGEAIRECADARRRWGAIEVAHEDTRHLAAKYRADREPDAKPLMRVGLSGRAVTAELSALRAVDPPGAWSARSGPAIDPPWALSGPADPPSAPAEGFASCTGGEAGPCIPSRCTCPAGRPHEMPQVRKAAMETGWRILLFFFFYFF